MLHKWIESLGYIRREDVRHIKFTDEEIISIISESFGDLDPFLDEDTNEDRDEEDRIFSILATVEGLQDYLRRTLSKDMSRHFKAQSPIQGMEIRGAFKRTAYWRKKLKQRGEGTGQTSLTSSRHL